MELEQKKVKVYTRKEWLEEAKSRFGENMAKWRFKCAQCGHVQSIESMIEHNPKLDPEEMRSAVYQECEGRHTKHQGCDWAIYGLFRIQKVEINFEGKNIPVFEFAD